MTALPARPRVLIVDDDRRVQQSLADVLRLTGRVAVVGCASDVRSSLQAIEELRPDVVLLDPRLPDVAAGSALVRTIQRSNPEIRVVLSGWSVTPEQPDLLGAACWYVSKNGTPEEFISAVVDACGATRTGPPAAATLADRGVPRGPVPS